jgi:hypothetical protein
VYFEFFLFFEDVLREQIAKYKDSFVQAAQEVSNLFSKDHI